MICGLGQFERKCSKMSKTFLVAVDGSDHGWKALDLATDLAKASDAAVLILHVIPYEPMPEGLVELAEVEKIPIEEERARYYAGRKLGDQIVNEAEARARNNGLARVATEVLEGNPASEIIALAKSKGVDMIVFGSRGLGDVKSLLMGSVSHKVMHLAPCTCVAVK
jgi:nucleotide-binding universal stress UspA family protein